MEISPLPENLLYAFPLSSTSNVRERRSVRFHPLSAGLGPPLSTRHVGQVPLRAVPARCSTPPGLLRSSTASVVPPLHSTPADLRRHATRRIKTGQTTDAVERSGVSWCLKE